MLHTRHKSIGSRLLAVVVAALVLAWPSAPRAEMKLFPVWTRMQCGSCVGGNAPFYACYNFVQVKRIYALDLDLQFKLAELAECRDKYDYLDQAYAKLFEANVICEESLSMLEARLLEKDDTLEDLSLELDEALEQNVWNYSPWLIAGAVVLAGAGFGLGFYLGDR